MDASEKVLFDYVVAALGQLAEVAVRSKGTPEVLSAYTLVTEARAKIVWSVEFRLGQRAKLLCWATEDGKTLMPLFTMEGDTCRFAAEPGAARDAN